MTSPTLKTKYNFSNNYFSAYSSKKLEISVKSSKLLENEVTHIKGIQCNKFKENELLLHNKPMQKSQIKTNHNFIEIKHKINPMTKDSLISNKNVKGLSKYITLYNAKAGKPSHNKTLTTNSLVELEKSKSKVKNPISKEDKERASTDYYMNLFNNYKSHEPKPKFISLNYLTICNNINREKKNNSVLAHEHNDLYKKSMESIKKGKINKIINPDSKPVITLIDSKTKPEKKAEHSLNHKINEYHVKKCINYTQKFNERAFLDNANNTTKETATLGNINSLYSINSSVNNFKTSVSRPSYNSKASKMSELASKNSRKSSKEKTSINNKQNTKTLKTSCIIDKCFQKVTPNQVFISGNKENKHILPVKPKLIKAQNIYRSCNIFNLDKNLNVNNKLYLQNSQLTHKKDIVKKSINSKIEFPKMIGELANPKKLIIPNKLKNENLIENEKKALVININTKLKFLDLSNSLNSVKNKIHNTMMNNSSTNKINKKPIIVSAQMIKPNIKIIKINNSKSKSCIEEKLQTKSEKIKNSLKASNLNKKLTFYHKNFTVSHSPICARKLTTVTKNESIKSTHNSNYKNTKLIDQQKNTAKTSIMNKIKIELEKYKKINDLIIKKHLLLVKTHPITFTNKYKSPSKPKKIEVDQSCFKIINKINSKTVDEAFNKKKAYFSIKQNTEASLLKDTNLISVINHNPKIDLLDVSYHSNKLNRKDHDYFSKESEKISTLIKHYYSKHSLYLDTNINFYKYGRLLGRGAFGKVNLGLHTLTGLTVAIKTFNKSSLTSSSSRYNIYKETNLMKNLRHKNIIKVYEVFESKKYVFIIMEYVCGGDLLSFVRKRTKIAENFAKFLFKQLIEALQCMHSQNITHRDIKLDNILIDLSGNIKICDFGISKLVKKEQVLYDQCGTPAYIAPEVMSEEGYIGFGADIWSAGIVLYAMLKGTVPFKANNIIDLNNRIISGKYQPISNISEEATDLLSKLIQVDPNKRINIREILNHAWFKIPEDPKVMSNLFTNAERILLSKSNVDYRRTKIEEIIENFTITNLDTLLELDHQNVITISAIFAPFNTTVRHSAKTILLDEDLAIEKEILKFTGKPKEANRNYELNNNGEIDNGFLIKIKEKSVEHLIDENKPMVESKYMQDHFDELRKHSSFAITSRDENSKKYSDNPRDLSSLHSTLKINENTLRILESLGYKKEYLIKCLNRNDLNYATAAYYLLVSHIESKNFK